MQSLVASCAILALVIGPVALVAAAIVNRGFSYQSLVAGGIGAFVCWAAGALALTATFLGNLLHAPVQAMLAGMLFRMGLPLIALVALPQLDARLAAGGITTIILAVYLVALVVETILALRMVPAQYGAAKPA